MRARLRALFARTRLLGAAALDGMSARSAQWWGRGPAPPWFQSWLDAHGLVHRGTASRSASLVGARCGASPPQRPAGGQSAALTATRVSPSARVHGRGRVALTQIRYCWQINKLRPAAMCAEIAIQVSERRDCRDRRSEAEFASSYPSACGRRLRMKSYTASTPSAQRSDDTRAPSRSTVGPGCPEALLVVAPVRGSTQGSI